ncbi:hypothetical protein N7517_009457 [Penicillium concentricum]|uniref:Uncharacterized protein n=1 Tax=Penicillium concentricum TaxID=293559 RepID=A0A9W9UZ69_9EURO|nr:uncharacterized protein N7517_009457 [Penicillium concentricum]KAJ5360266.1 hypothetical protein N7517_009457 [Penicillium concentricum]
MSFFTNPPRRGRHDAGSGLYPPPQTQATDLPKESPVTLLNITKLKSESSLTVWGNEIIHVLRPLKLDALVASDLPRPHPEDPDYSKWKFWTLVVARWLFNQVDTSIQHKVKAHSNDLAFADEIFNAIKLLSLHSQSKFLANEVKRWEELKRENFSTPAEFIMAYQNQYNRLKTENHEPSCDFALGRLLQELHGEVMKVPFIQEEVKDLRRPVNYQLFVYYCKVLIDESRKPTVSAGPSASEDASVGIYGELRGRSSSHGRDISYRGWRQSTKGRGPAWE